MTFVMASLSYVSFAHLLLLVLRFLLGLFECPVGPASARVIAAWFPSAERGVAGAIFNSAQYISLVLFTRLMGWLDHQFGWHFIFAVMGVLGIALGLVWLILFEV